MNYFLIFNNYFQRLLENNRKIDLKKILDVILIEIILNPKHINYNLKKNKIKIIFCITQNFKYKFIYKNIFQLSLIFELTESIIEVQLYI